MGRVEASGLLRRPAGRQRSTCLEPRVACTDALLRPHLRPRLFAPCRTHAERKSNMGSSPCLLHHVPPTAVPGAVQPALHFYNVPVSVDTASPANPLNIIRKIYRPGDFIVSEQDSATLVAQGWLLAGGSPAIFLRPLRSSSAAVLGACGIASCVQQGLYPRCCWAGLGGRRVAVWGRPEVGTRAASLLGQRPVLQHSSRPSPPLCVPSIPRLPAAYALRPMCAGAEA